VMAFEIATFQQRWLEARHPMLNFFFNTHHPDIDIGPFAPPPSLIVPRRTVAQGQENRCEMAVA